MNLVKIYDKFKGPDEVTGRIHIIGCGAVGSVVAEMLARFGFTNIVLYDFDIVEEKNIANQMFFNKHIGMNKTDATKDIMMEINPDCKDVVCNNGGWTGQELDGYVFLCPDSIKVRRDFYDINQYNIDIKGIIDFRMGLFDADVYLVDFRFEKIKRNYRKTMNFNDEDVKQERSACHETLSFCPTIRGIVATGIASWVKNLHSNNELDGRHWYINMNPYEAKYNICMQY